LNKVKKAPYLLKKIQFLHNDELCNIQISSLINSDTNLKGCIHNCAIMQAFRYLEQIRKYTDTRAVY
jgi:hypothetical protein